MGIPTCAFAATKNLFPYLLVEVGGAGGRMQGSRLQGVGSINPAQQVIIEYSTVNLNQLHGFFLLLSNLFVFL